MGERRRIEIAELRDEHGARILGRGASAAHAGEAADDCSANGLCVKGSRVCDPATRLHGPSGDACVHPVRPIFKALIACALAAGLDVGVATFSSQPELIAHILALAVPCDGIDRVVVRAGLRAVAGADPVAEVPDELRARFMAHGSGKQGHIVSIVQRVEARDGKQLEPREVWLIDDDENNVVQARRNGMQAVQFDANKPDSIPGVVPERPAPG